MMEQYDMTKEGYAMNDDPLSSPKKTSPGQWLKSARESFGMNTATIAKKLKLSEKVILLIESDQYESLGAFMFVRGYLRSYAREVKLPEDDLVRAFNDLDLTEPDTQNVKIAFQQKPAKKSYRSLFRWLTVFIVLLLIALVALWWYGQRAPVNQESIDIKPIVPSQQSSDSTSSTSTKTISKTASRISTSVLEYPKEMLASAESKLPEVAEKLLAHLTVIHKTIPKKTNDVKQIPIARQIPTTRSKKTRKSVKLASPF